MEKIYETLLCALLDCGTLDLTMLKDTDSDYLCDAIDRLKDEGAEISLNGIFNEMFYQAAGELNDALETRIGDLECFKDAGPLEEGEEEELKALKTLNPEDDVTWYVNWMDTHIYICSDKEEIYREYLDGPIEELERLMGFEFE